MSADPQSRSPLRIAYRPERCAVPDHRGIATEFVGPVRCTVNRALLMEVRFAKEVRALAEQLRSMESARVWERPGESEPPLAFRLVG